MSRENDGSLTTFIEVNGAFLLTTFGMLSACVSGMTLYFLKSRCTKIDCFCIKCEREPLSEQNLSEINLSTDNV